MKKKKEIKLKNINPVKIMTSKVEMGVICFNNLNFKECMYLKLTLLHLHKLDKLKCLYSKCLKLELTLHITTLLPNNNNLMLLLNNNFKYLLNNNNSNNTKCLLNNNIKCLLLNNNTKCLLLNSNNNHLLLIILVLLNLTILNYE